MSLDKEMASSTFSIHLIFLPEIHFPKLRSRSRKEVISQMKKLKITTIKKNYFQPGSPIYNKSFSSFL